MSNPLAIAAVTATLRNLIAKGLESDPDLGGVEVTMQPLDKARASSSTKNQMNVFLYHVTPSGTWRNMAIPGQVRSGESGFPVLGLNLYYLLTAFGAENDATRPFSHHLLGRAMSVLHDHPLLGADEIKAAFPKNDLWTQIERVRFTLQPFSVEEIAKLWTGFQTQYRLSVAYEAAVVLIESARPKSMPLPVLMRGPGDTGVIVQPSLLPPFPAIDTVAISSGQPTATLGDTLTLKGNNLDGDKVTILFSNRHLASPVPISTNKVGNATEITVDIPKNAPADWPAGMYTLSALVSRKDSPDRESNLVSFALAPKVTSKVPINAKSGNGDVTVKLNCSPEVRPDQQALLLLGTQSVPADDHPAQTKQLTFVVRNAVPGEYRLRLRVDGVDSQLIDPSTTPPKFDDSQKVVIT